MKKIGKFSRSGVVLVGGFSAALLLSFAFAAPAQAVGSSSIPCDGGTFLGHSTATTNSNYSNASECNDAVHARIRLHYNVSGGGAVTRNWATSATYVLTEYMNNPGYPVFQGDHQYNTAVGGWEPTDPILSE